MNSYKLSTGSVLYFSFPIIFFIINYLLKLIGLDYFKTHYLLIVLLIVLFPLSYLLQTKLNTSFTKKIYLLSVYTSFFFGAMSIFLLLSLLINRFISFAYLKTTLIISLVVILISFIQARSYFVKILTIYSQKITKLKTIVQISDTHFYGYDAKKDVKQIVSKIKKLNPDIVVITGDLLDNYGAPSIDSLEPFNELKKDIYYVYGNHEKSSLSELAPKIIVNSKIKLLVNETITVGDLEIIGIDDDSKIEMKYELEKQKINDKKFSILLQHKPLNEVVAANKKIDLMLSGHLHAGQVFPLNIILKQFIKYVSGTYNVKNMFFHISKGTGTRSIPIRFGYSNEITLIKLKPKK